MSEPVEAAGTVELDVGAVEFGETGQFEDLGEPVAGPCAQAVGGALDEPLGGEVHVVAEPFGGHDGDG